MKKTTNYFAFIFTLMTLWSCDPAAEKAQQTVESETTPSKYTRRGWNILSNHRENGLRTLDSAAAYGVNYIELSHYQLCHNLKDLKNPKIRESVNFFADAAHERGIEDVFVWDHAFYEMDYYPDEFKVEASGDQDLSHHTKHFEGGKDLQLDLDNPKFWEWVYADYDSLLSLAPNVNGITLTFIETGSYVIYQHSDVLTTRQAKVAALVDSLANYFIDRKGMKLTIRTFIYNQFEKESIVKALGLIQRKDIHVMVKMVPHDWFMTYPYQDFIQDIPFPTIIEYDCGMEYAGENVIADPFVNYFTQAFKYYDQFDHVVGYCARTDRFEETAAVGTPGEVNMYALSRLAKDPSTTETAITNDFLTKNYGADAAELLKPAFDSAWEVVMASMYTLGQHTPNHSRLNFHRDNIYLTHTTGEWYSPDEQMWTIKHNVNQTLHNYKDILNAMAFPKFKQDEEALRKDLAWVADSAWFSPEELMTKEYLDWMMTEKQYAIDLAMESQKAVEAALPKITNEANKRRLKETFDRTVLFTQERKAVMQAVYGYRLWSRGKEYQTDALKSLILESLNEADSLISVVENSPTHIPLGQWRWHRDREEFEIYRKAITETGWVEFGLEGVVVSE